MIGLICRIIPSLNKTRYSNNKNDFDNLFPWSLYFFRVFGLSNCDSCLSLGDNQSPEKHSQGIVNPSCSILNGLADEFFSVWVTREIYCLWLLLKAGLAAAGFFWDHHGETCDHKEESGYHSENIAQTLESSSWLFQLKCRLLIHLQKFERVSRCVEVFSRKFFHLCSF